MVGLSVVHLDGDAFTVAVRDHQVTVDQPIDAGGSDTGPTPTELFVASLAGCVAFYARRYLARPAVPEDGLRVVADAATAARPIKSGRSGSPGRFLGVLADLRALWGHRDARGEHPRPPPGVATGDDPWILRPARA